MKKKNLNRLNLNRETLRYLDEASLRTLPGIAGGDSYERDCQSRPTLNESCLCATQ